MEADILLCQLVGHLYSFLFSLEGRASFAGRDSALSVDSRVTWGASGDNDVATAICAAPSV